MTSAPLGELGAPTSRTDLVVETLKRAILDGSLKPGEALSERELAARLGVSKTPVRDALKLLKVTGLIEISSFQQVTVRQIDAGLVTELYRARAYIEPEATALAALNRTPGPFEPARAALADAAAAAAQKDLATQSLQNRRFHRLLYAGCGNRFLIDELDQLQDLTALSATVGWRVKHTGAAEAREHQAILSAFEAGEADETRGLVRAHVAQALDTICSTMPTDA